MKIKLENKPIDWTKPQLVEYVENAGIMIILTDGNMTYEPNGEQKFSGTLLFNTTKYGVNMIIGDYITHWYNYMGRFKLYDGKLKLSNK